jgi:hypothetical protein
MNQNILGIELVCTCGACPEQYDAFIDGEMVGYFRLRHGRFRVDYPDVGGATLLSEATIGDGIFDESERMDCLTRGCTAILLRRAEDRKETTLTKDDKFEILDLIEDVLTRCEDSIYKPESETYHSVVNPEKARKAIQAIKDSLNYRGEP